MIQTVALLSFLLLPQNDPSQGRPAVTDGKTGAVFYGIWPALVVAAGFVHRRRHT